MRWFGVSLWFDRECSPFKLLLLGFVAMMSKAAMRARMSSGSRKMSEVVKESRCNDTNGIDCHEKYVLVIARTKCIEVM